MELVPVNHYNVYVAIACKQ